MSVLWSQLFEKITELDEAKEYINQERVQTKIVFNTMTLEKTPIRQVARLG